MMKNRPKGVMAAKLVVCALIFGVSFDAEGAAPVIHRSIEIDGVRVAYREAGEPGRPVILLLHGFPTSSQMFRELMPVLGVHYHVLAPDYPGYGDSDMPSVNEFTYTFAHMADIVMEFLKRKKVDDYVVYLMDYGAPIGLRCFARAPRRVRGFIIQNGNAYKEGLEAFWDPIKALWKDRNDENEWALRRLLTLEATKWQYTHGVPKGRLDRVSPDNWYYVQYLLDRPGNQEIQLQMFYDYRTNVAQYAKWQRLFREYQPPALITWGRNDFIFPETGAHPYERDLKRVEKHILDAGHFALETHGPEIAAEILDFMRRLP